MLRQEVPFFSASALGNTAHAPRQGRSRFDICGRFLRLYPHHAVPDPDMGLDILRRARLFFQFLAQGRHKYAQGGNIVFPASSPNLLGDKRVSQHLTDIFAQQAQQFVFAGS